MARIGIYGGSFNPPHIGHLRAAQAAMDTLGLDKLLLIPAGIAPHKEEAPGSPTALQRLEMVGLGAGERMEVSPMEILREGKSYTYLTVEALKEQYPEDQLILLMGTDMFLSFHTWKNPDRITRNATLGVFYRGDRDEMEAIREKKEQMQAQGAQVVTVENPVVEISSTQIRRMLILGGSEAYLPEQVRRYIFQKGLYGTGESYRDLPVEKLEQTVIRLLKPSRVAHVLGCRDMAQQLAHRWGADPTDAVRGALLHDVTKALDGPLQLSVCESYGCDPGVFSRQNPKTLHALTGSLAARSVFGENEAVVSAIASHTTGKANMNTLEKILYLADYVERTRDFPGVEQLRQLAFTDLNGAMVLGLEMTLDLLRRQGREISPESLEALTYYKNQSRKKEEI